MKRELIEEHHMQRRRRIRFACALAASAFMIFAAGRSVLTAEKVEARVVSGRPDMVTGGDALVEITGVAPAAASSAPSVNVNGRDVTSAFLAGPAGGPLLGRIDGLAIGRNTLEVRVNGRRRASLELTNYPLVGPVFSGSHQVPFICQTEAAGLGPALDTDCTARTAVTYVYKSTELPPVPNAGSANAPAASDALPAGFKPFDPSAPRPADIARTTTTEGRSVDYIVRRERGTINRGIYEVTFLHVPGQPLPDPWTKTPGWNGRLVYSFGVGCAAGYHQGGTQDGINDTRLSAGYASAVSSLTTFGNNCDDVISAETMMMVKEHFIEQFGVPVHTIGTGSSGGSMQQHLIAQNYPGLLDGITPHVSYPDVVTMVADAVDCALLAHAFDGATQAWTDAQKTAVSGFATWRTCTDGWMPFSHLIRPAGCTASIPKSQVYDPATNPTGVRCAIHDNEVNVYGRDPNTGFARRPLDNVGVQYGLTAFNAGHITTEQFLELNARVGGYDADGNIVAARTTADPVALRLAYETGRVNSGAGSLGSIPIIDSRPYLDSAADIHDSFRSFATRARLLAANGGAGNHVILRMPIGDGPGAQPVNTIRLMDSWLDNIANDRSNEPVPVKVVRNRPSEAVDACWTEAGERIVEPAVYGGAGRCNQLYPPFADPRIAAGGPLADDILKCALRPVEVKDYKQPLTPDQIARLKAIFPLGVCDYSRPGVGQRSVNGTWKKY
jgi:hypothetical protein